MWLFLTDADDCHCYVWELQIEIAPLLHLSVFSSLYTCVFHLLCSPNDIRKKVTQSDEGGFKSFFLGGGKNNGLANIHSDHSLVSVP